MDVVMEVSDGMVDVSNKSREEEEEEERRRKRQKKKKTNRPPLCTFVNYLAPPTTTVATPAATSSVPNVPATISEPSTEHAEDEEDDDDDVMMKGVIVTDQNSNSMETSPLSNDRPVLDDEDLTPPITIPSTQLFVVANSRSDNDDDNESVETVNTSNKSVDVYLRPDGSFDHIPAAERWKKPPPPVVSDMLEKLDGLYVTSRCESDDELEEQPRPLPEIVVKTRRHRLPSLHSQWRTKHSKRYCLG
ncbi:expressed unknown protein [Seminavis robusta]|uniref:Uncharacterized protein n=1 Tax=Seminavis robusta TaxID=568900 RepID=A0A9N8F2C2_9STRA|nr:expressed unknown protein [Seminavis robusta]|eukprot:Sro2793_g337240.1 n/a (247) ;mRNA; r:2626-3366